MGEHGEKQVTAGRCGRRTDTPPSLVQTSAFRASFLWDLYIADLHAALTPAWKKSRRRFHIRRRGG